MKELYFGMYYTKQNDLLFTHSEKEIEGVVRQVKVVFGDDGLPVSVELVNDQNTNH